MTFDQLYSSSTGNLYVVTANNSERLLIECGVAWPKLIKALNYNLEGIKGCLLTHEHIDHSKAIHDVIKAGIDVFASKGTIDAIDIKGRHIRYIKNRDVGLIGNTLRFKAFNTNHDAAEPLGFIVHEIATGENLLFATDTSHITQRFKLKFDIIAICCSYNGEYLAKRVKEKTINETVAKRLLTAHMEHNETKRYLSEFCDLSRTRVLHLLHLSHDNINKKKIKADFEKTFFIQTVIKGLDK